MFDIANQLLTHHSPFAPLGQVDEWTAKPSPFLVRGCLSEFSRIMAAKTLINSYRYRQWRSNFPGRERKPKYEEKQPKLTYLVALVKAILAAGNENRQLEDFPQAAFSKKNYTHCCFCNDSTHFSSWASAPTYFTIFIRGWSILLFSFVNKVDFSCQWKAIVSIWQTK